MSSFQPSFLQKLRGSVLLSDIVAPVVKLTLRGREMTGLCPFHQEKSPSFTLNNEKGIYYCFGCGAHGDAISFLRATQSLTFVEAVTRLAESIGLPLEMSDARGGGAEELARKQLYAVLERACAYFESQLASFSGERARDYLQRRGISEVTQRQFRLGWAPALKNVLQKELQKEGFSTELLLRAGLLGTSEKGEGVYDRFRERLMFPILDAQGRVIAFGGRLLEPNPHAPKYLNSPETELFVKKKSIYGAYQAGQTPLLKGKPVVWVEGYMDVLSLQQAGVAKAFAPLGTALTEQQLLKAWHLDPEPIVCFDGDLPGQKAAFRVVERVFPLLKPGYSLRFVKLPQGEDPDSLLATGRGALFEALLGTALSLVDFLWQHHVETLPLRTPEQKAFFYQALKDLVATIQDASIKSLYFTFVKKKWDQLLAQERQASWRSALAAGGKRHVPMLESRAASKPLFDRLYLQRRILLVILLNHPSLLGEVGELLATLDLPAQGGLSELRDALLALAASEEMSAFQGDARVCLKEALEKQGLAEVVHRILTPDVYVHALFSRPEASLEQARAGWYDVLAQYQKQSSLRQELQETQKLLGDHMSEDIWKRLRFLKESSFIEADS